MAARSTKKKTKKPVKKAAAKRATKKVAKKAAAKAPKTTTRTAGKKATKKAVAIKRNKTNKPAKKQPVELHGIWLSGPTYKVALMLALSGQRFVYKHLDLRAGQHKKPEFLALNRFGQVPCLVDGDTALCQSGAILEYLAEKLGKFRGRTQKERLQAREWIYWDFDKLAPPIYRLRAIRRGFMQVAPEVEAYFRARGEEALATLEQTLGRNVWLAGGNSPTIADIDSYGVVSYCGDAGFELEDHPNVRAWIKRFEDLKRFGRPDQLMAKS